MSDRPHILLATLGGQPQVVTFTLDLLLRDFPISHVIVIHPTATTQKLQRSLQILQAEFVDDYYRAGERVIHFRSQILRMDNDPIEDIVDDMHADATLETIPPTDCRPQTPGISYPFIRHRRSASDGLTRDISSGPQR